MCILMGRGSWGDSGVAGSPVVSGGLAWEGLDFFVFLDVSFWGCFMGCFVVWRVFLFCFGVVLVLFSY